MTSDHELLSNDTAATKAMRKPSGFFKSSMPAVTIDADKEEIKSARRWWPDSQATNFFAECVHSNSKWFKNHSPGRESDD